jgi:hypothetical protein
MNKQKHLNAFKELITRLRLIEKDLLKSKNLPNLSRRIEVVYAGTIKQLMSEGGKYLSMNPDPCESIRIAIDVDKYTSTLECLGFKSNF